MKYLCIILALAGCVFLEYIPDFYKSGIDITFPFSDMTQKSQWYWYIVYKDLQIVVLAWALWFWAIPKELKIIKAGVAIFCTFLTLAPIYFVLFYSVPYTEWVFAIKVAVSILIGFFYFKYNDGVWGRNDTGSNYN